MNPDRSWHLSRTGRWTQNVFQEKLANDCLVLSVGDSICVQSDAEQHQDIHSADSEVAARPEVDDEQQSLQPAEEQYLNNLQPAI